MRNFIEKTHYGLYMFIAFDYVPCNYEGSFYYDGRIMYRQRCKGYCVVMFVTMFGSSTGDM